MRLIIRLIIQTIRQDPSGSVQTDEASNASRPDPSGADQIDAEHQGYGSGGWGFESLAAHTPQVSGLGLMSWGYRPTADQEAAGVVTPSRPRRPEGR
jgi:hypothetical protein